jgi:hypothetical protein
MHDGEKLEGFVFAKVRPGEAKLAGSVFEPAKTLLSGVTGKNGLVRNKLSEDKLAEWRREIERLARAFIEGDAQIDPREYPMTCKDCGLQSICRVQENVTVLTAEEDYGFGEDGDD